MEKTITSIFIRPTLKFSRNELTENGYINSFIRDDIFQTKYEDCVYLLFRPKYINKFRNFVYTEYERTKLIIADWKEKDLFSNDKREELWYNFNEASETLNDESLNDLFFNNQ